MSTLTLIIALTAIAILCIMLFIYERSKPTARNIVPVVIICVIASLGRIIFSVIPGVQPVTATVIIMAVCFGKRAGFITGALCALISNLYIGHGPWTPWQMLAWGTIGILTALITKHVSDENKAKSKAFIACMLPWCFLCAYIYSTVTDFWTVSTLVGNMPSYGVFGVFVAGWIYAIPHSIANVIFFLLLYHPLSKMLMRLKHKYGIMA